MRTSLTPVTLADLAKLESMRKDFYQTCQGNFDETRDRHTLEQLLGNPQLGQIYFLISSGKPVGYAIITFCFSIEFAGRFALLDEIYLSPGSRNQGLGSDALQLLEESLRPLDISALRLEVEHTNSAAQRFYATNGLHLEGRRLMTKWLPPHIVP